MAIRSRRISRPGVSVPFSIRYASTSAPSNWLMPERGRPILNAILDAVEDGDDRAILAWPMRPGGGFAVAAVALREARASGRLAYATLALWPWRSGATWGARSILVHPGDIATTAARIVDEIQHGAAWAKSGLAQESLCLLEMRLRDLLTKPDSSTKGGGASASALVVRNPTLLETTAVFVPVTTGQAAAYASDGAQVLRRVRDHTHMGDRDADLAQHVDAIGNPLKTPFGVFGLPADAKPETLARCLDFPRFKRLGLDAVIVDLTQAGRKDLPDDWGQRFASLLQALAHVPGRRPPVVVLSEDAFTLRRAVRALRSYGAASRPSRKPPLEIGAYLPEQGLLGPASTLTSDLKPIAFEADIKDASLAGLRDGLLSLGRNFRQAGEPAAAASVSKALAFLRRSASLPIGLKEARYVTDILHDGDDEVDNAARTLFRPKMALSRLAMAAEMVPQFGEATRRLIAEVEAKVQAWEDETPVSAKLVQVLLEPVWNASDVLLSVPDRRTADVYLSSDRALGVSCEIIDHRALFGRMIAIKPRRVIVVGPTLEAIRALLTIETSPDRALLLGDAAGSALLAAELAPLTRIPAFAAVAQRARPLTAALQRGGADEKLDLAEAEFRIVATLPEALLDFTRAGEAYSGDIVQFKTSRIDHIRYRPNSDVLEFSPGELRPFERKAARTIRAGDRILVLSAALREPIRRALAGSQETLKQLAIYHTRIAAIYSATPGVTDQDKARYILAKMQELDPTLPAQELPNIVRWLTAHKAPSGADGIRQPRAARDWPRFRTFMQAVGVDSALADIFFRGAIVPARSYRVQEGYLFNQRVVQFVLDPEGAAAGAAAWRSMPELWQLVLDAVDEVLVAQTLSAEEVGKHG
ncbi:hypothetical protein [Parvibaculum sp.]|jgi:hypothetical protein|uniref:hypothetical protein n=3 Tax=Alphaproteobacteria TaxID=28211 RepID=UPI003296F7C9